jgi:hypothetical protein
MIIQTQKRMQRTETKTQNPKENAKNRTQKRMQSTVPKNLNMKREAKKRSQEKNPKIKEKPNSLK